MQDNTSQELRGTLCGIIDAAYDCSLPYRVTRSGLIFERSGHSMAVYDGEFRIDRIDLDGCDDYSFAHAVDLWLLNRYMAEVA